MTETIHLLMILAFLSVWLMIGSDLVARHARNSNGEKLSARSRRNR